jgi:hypothetical protein
MLEIVQFLTEKSRTLEELKGVIGDDLEAEELLQLGFRLCKKGKGKATKEIVEVDEHYQAWAENPSGPATLPDSIADPTLDLPWVDFQLQARLTHALPYVYYQGKTVANKTLWLMSVKSRHFTMRHLIMGLGRVQESIRVKILHPDREAAHILLAAKEAFRMYEERTRAHVQEEARTRALLEAAENAVNAEMDEGEFDDCFSEDSEGGVAADPFADVDFDN